MESAFEPLSFRSGRTMPNRIVLAPLTNQQSNADGTMSDEEYRFLTMRAQGGFGATMTCASHVQANGQGFPGQMGIFDDAHIPGLTRLTAGINEHDSLALVQLHHAGNRAPDELIEGQPVGASADSDGTLELSIEEIAELVSAFARAAARAEASGFDGAEIHGAHGYVINQFLSPEINQRKDGYGGSHEGRSRLLYEVLAAVHAATSDDFIVGVRISPERFGMVLGDAIELVRALLVDDRVDFVDVSLWDCDKEPEDPEFAGRRLGDYFTELPRDGVRLGLAGKIYQPADVNRVLEMGADFVSLGRGAILNHDFPRRMRQDPGYVATTSPASGEHLRSEGLSQPFIDYMSNWPNFVAGD